MVFRRFARGIQVAVVAVDELLQQRKCEYLGVGKGEGEGKLIQRR